MRKKPKFICRASAIGALMTNPREKSNRERYDEAVATLQKLSDDYANTENKETKKAQNICERIRKTEATIKELEKTKDKIHLSKSCVGIVHEWMRYKLGYPAQEFSNKYTQKGVYGEHEAIAFASNYYGWGNATKNTERKTNEYITGECDVVLQDRIVDLKTVWSGDTMPMIFDEIVPIDGYAYQGLAYLELWGKPTFQLTYVLINTPEFILDRIANSKRIELGLDEVDAELWEEVQQKHTYDHLPDFLRIKSFTFERDTELMQPVYERVELCRKYVEQSGFYELLERVEKEKK